MANPQGGSGGTGGGPNGTERTNRDSKELGGGDVSDGAPVGTGDTLSGTPGDLIGGPAPQAGGTGHLPGNDFDIAADVAALGAADGTLSDAASGRGEAGSGTSGDRSELGGGGGGTGPSGPGNPGRDGRA